VVTLRGEDSLLEIFHRGIDRKKFENRNKKFEGGRGMGPG
jgi:hypothetical protein